MYKYDRHSASPLVCYIELNKYSACLPKFNEQLSREKYFQIFGEEALDLLYIPGAVYDGSIVLN